MTMTETRPDDDITATDLFCGAGGSSIGAEVHTIGITWWCDGDLAVAELTEIVGMP